MIGLRGADRGHRQLRLLSFLSRRRWSSRLLPDAWIHQCACCRIACGAYLQPNPTAVICSWPAMIRRPRRAGAEPTGGSGRDGGARPGSCCWCRCRWVRSGADVPARGTRARDGAAGAGYSSAIHAVNRYGLFAVMTRERQRSLLEGSVDGVTWLPRVQVQTGSGSIAGRTCSCPHQPRLDWQMWFAALRSYRRGGWLDALLHFACCRARPMCSGCWIASATLLWPQTAAASRHRYRYEFRPGGEKATGASLQASRSRPYLGPVRLPSRWDGAAAQNAGRRKQRGT